MSTSRGDVPVLTFIALSLLFAWYILGIVVIARGRPFNYRLLAVTGGIAAALSLGVGLAEMEGTLPFGWILLIAATSLIGAVYMFFGLRWQSRRFERRREGRSGARSDRPGSDPG
jgi:CHASE2 domain-containing sensor protein